MAAFDIEPLRKPLPGDAPCGPDMEAAEDPDYLNFTVEVEGLLPESYFDDDGKAFDRSSFDFKREYGRLRPLMAGTRDLRLFVLLARFCALDRDLTGFAGSLASVVELLTEFWDGLHPVETEFTEGARSNALSQLAASTVIIPLQYMPLCQSRRFGAICYRQQMFAAGEAKPREGEQAPGAGNVVQAIQDADKAEMEAVRGKFAQIASAVDALKMLWITHDRSSDAPNLDRLKDVAAKAVALIDAALPRADAEAPAEGADADAEPGAAGAPGQPAAAPAGAVASAAAAQAALQAAISYFRRKEPSSPALPLLTQAHALHGKSFLEVMQALIPNKVSEAAFHIGGQQFFDLPVESLPPPPDEPAPDEAPEEAPPVFQAATRQQALALIDRAAGFFKSAEPSSPVPWLVERARALAERDFLSLLRDVLPKNSLNEIGAED